jgi:peptide/nickel transport system substrate-binding protein
MALLVSCAPTSRTSSPADQSPAPRATSLLRIVNREDPAHISVKAVGGDYTSRLVSRLFNAQVALQDEHMAYHPELVEALPQVGTDSWRVFPDGQMETTYRLKPNLTWHDGAPFTADDLVFAYEVYRNPDFGQAAQPPQKSMQEVAAPDARTLVIHWRELYPGADSISRGEGSFGDPFPPLPRHILEEPMKRSTPDTFATSSYWTTDYVGLGPFRLDRWERGAFLEAAAFDGYALGRPKIDRIRVAFIADGNTIAANFLAGELDLGAEESVRPELGTVLRDEWQSRGAGVVDFVVTDGRRTDIQLEPARVNPAGLLDLRLRRALAHAIDKDALNEGMQRGLGRGADTWVMPDDDIFPDVQRVMTKYPYDMQRAGQLLAEAGYTRGSDGFYASPTGERLAMRVDYVMDPAFDQETAIMADSLKRAGIDLAVNPLSRAQWRDPTRGPAFPALQNQGGGVLENLYAQVPTPENRFVGTNRGSWQNAEYDRLQSDFRVTLDRSQRNAQLVQMAKVVSEEVPSIPLYYRVKVVARNPQLQGVILGDRVKDYWNVHLWELR